MNIKLCHWQKLTLKTTACSASSHPDVVRGYLSLDLSRLCSVPTLVLAECVLIYLEAKDSEKLVQWAGEKLKTGVFVIYEQVSFPLVWMICS